METWSFERVVLAEHLTALRQTFGDMNPLHVDRGVAAAHGFPNEIAHGAILVGMLSEIMGVGLGEDGLTICCGIQISFERTFYEGDRLRFDVQLTRRSAAIGVTSYEFAVMRSSERIARGTFMTKFAESRAYALAQGAATG